MPVVLEILAPQNAVLAGQVPRFDQLQSGSPAAAITVLASPFTYQNVSGGPGCIIVSGGTVTTISWSRDGAGFLLVGLLAGMFYIGSGDFLRVAYVLAPTMTFFPF